MTNKLTAEQKRLVRQLIKCEKQLSVNYLTYMSNLKDFIDWQRDRSFLIPNIEKIQEQLGLNRDESNDGE